MLTSLTLAVASANLGVLPYIDIPELSLGPLPIRPFGILVVVAILVGAHIAGKRAVKLGLNQERFSSLVFWTVASGIVISHVLDTLWYYPEVVLERPWELLMIHRGLSSFGGFTGAAIGFFIYGRKHKIDLWKASDAIAFGLPFGWFFGRMGCAVVHDHPGAYSEHFMAVAFPGGARFDLGLLEMLLTPILWVAVIVAVRIAKRPGAPVIALALVYPFLRFPLDFLRAPKIDGGDIRYFGLTPGQYASMALLALGIFLLVRYRQTSAKLEEEPTTTQAVKKHKAKAARVRG